MYDVPGQADAAPSVVRNAWNAQIQAIFNSFVQRHPGTFLVSDPATLVDGRTVRAVRWASAPAVPLDCLNRDESLTRSLCDFGIRGRHVLHNEYLEYMVIQRQDATGRMRPKRVVMTTELREYWTILAVQAPEFCRDLASGLVGRPLEWPDLYGPGVTDPLELSEDERLRRFSVEVAGDGGGDVIGVPSQPRGRLNTENLLFMTHPINGLDDLIFIVMFGAKPYVVRRADGTLRDPTKFEIFGNGNPLACRNADPGAATAASAQARSGRKLAFANPLGMYILTEPDVLRQQFFLNDAAESEIPEEWIRLSRGQDGMHQRLEFGPDDENNLFLDDIQVATGAQVSAVRGGYDVAKKVEVGPLLLVEREPSVNPVRPVLVAEIPEAERRPCSQSPECADIIRLLQEFESAQP
jgi:hypothetical protein